MRGVSLRLGIATLAASLYTFCVDGGVINGSDAAELASRVAPGYLVALWVTEDARRTRYWPAYHYALFVWGLGYVAVPHYFWRTRGRAGIPAALGLVLLLLLPTIAGFVGWSLYESLPDLR